MKKLALKTTNLAEENIQKLSSLFPNLITEKENEQGELIKTIDVEKLKELVGDYADENSEVYSLGWVGKSASRRKIAESINKTLRPAVDESVDFEKTKNVFIEGDNFEVLKLLRESYLNSIKMIYIDPPYNTGKDFVYKDNFTKSREEYDVESKAVDEEGNKEKIETINDEVEYAADVKGDKIYIWSYYYEIGSCEVKSNGKTNYEVIVVGKKKNVETFAMEKQQLVNKEICNKKAPN